MIDDRELIDFLLARIAEDETWSKGRLRLPCDGRPDDPARVLAECEAKRAIVRHCQLVLSVPGEDVPELRHLAAIYNDHPDYREEWRS